MALSPALMNMVSAAKNKYKGGGGKTMKPGEGQNVYRIIAPKPGPDSWVPDTGQFWADLGINWIKPGKDAKPMVVLGDSEIVYQRPSPINVAINLAIQSAMDEESKELYESWLARKSVIVNAKCRKTGEVGPLELTPTTFSKYLELVEIYAGHGQDITDSETGIDIIITKTGKMLNTKYDIAVSPAGASPLDKEDLAKAEDLYAFIDRNYFRGEEQKGLTAISQIAGIAVPALPSPNAAAGGTGAATTPTPALASPAASLAVEPSAEEIAQRKAAAQAAADAKTQADALAAAKALLAAEQQKEQLANAGVVQTESAKTADVVDAEAVESSMSEDDQAKLLAELDSLAS